MNAFDSMIHGRVQVLERKAIAASSRVFLLTNRTLTCYRRLLPDYEGFSVVSDCVAPYHLSYDGEGNQAAEQLLGACGLPATCRIVLYVGRVAHEKGWKTFVEVAARLVDRGDLHFLVLGDGPQRKAMELAARRVGLDGRFHVTGFVSHRVVPAVMRRANVLLMPSLHEELGGTVLEATAAGVPVVASAVGGLVDVLTDGRTALLCRPGDVESFTSATRRLVDNPTEGRRLVRTARAEILGSFTPDSVLPSVIEVYRAVLAENNVWGVDYP
jgi:2-deoxystreptamine N-acetyl-D-glucosaminyltransferase/2-deoxystreptamine glucosyltransferase